ncbi:MAG: glycosyltransferase family 39 protein [Candidatus Eremiobacteraeota bacterium]|nr:glycosyltransferase family 39 protein [Candidatus Eremiobacteraeota bacterium]
MNETERGWLLALGAILILGLALRLVGIHNPILDHPGWRQGDTAAIARNFAELRFNILFPQTDYDGPPPNYVELELQIVPFVAALGYKLFGIHEIFGRLVSLAFSLGTVAVVGYFARWLFFLPAAGLCAALLYAIFPGSVYYGRTFTPDGTMAFFLTAALFAGTRWLLRPAPVRIPAWNDVASAALLALAFLAKPVATLAIVPLLAVDYLRVDARRALLQSRALLIVVPALGLLVAYLAFVGGHAEWHWASGITSKHVVPSLWSALASPHALAAKTAVLATQLSTMFATTIAGPAGFALCALGFVFMPRARSRALLYAWLAAGVLYAFVVVTVERVDYYLYPLLPLAALAGGGFLGTLWERVPRTRTRALLAAVVLLAVVANNEAQIWPYYRYRHAVYAGAKALDRRLQPGVLVVMAHYDPSVLYYINRKGWQEDPYVWTPVDEQSAIAKGARYLIAVEDRRLQRNVELAAWLQRFPLLQPPGLWPVYETDYAKMLPGAEERWREFRRREKAGAQR